MKIIYKTSLERLKFCIAHLRIALFGFTKSQSQRAWLRFHNWWERGYKRYGVNWAIGTKITGVALIGVIVGGLVAPVAHYFYSQSRYHLSDDVHHLIGNSVPKLASQITYDKKKDTYQFNKDAVTTSSLPQATQQTTAGVPNSKKAATFSVDLPTNLSQGITYHETNAQLSFTMTPHFGAADGRNMNGQLIYPLNNGAQAIYSLKGNGVKEDIVLEGSSEDTMSFGYTLNLPKTLAARLIEGTGNIGIYSVDPTILGDVSTATASDAAMLQKARENGQKTNLLFTIPAPVIKSAGGKSGFAKASFTLAGDNLTVNASGLKGLKGPISIDPSVVVTSTSDLQLGGNSDGNIDFSTAGQVNRGALTGGSVSAGGSDPGTGIIVHYAHGGAVYNGYMYIAGGNGLANLVYYVQLNANGSLGTWTAATNLPYTRVYLNMQAYNGFMYVYGGYRTSASASVADVSYAPIASNGSLGTWSTSENQMAAATCRFSSAIYNGYLYALGGATTAASGCGNTSTPINTVQFAPILANGDVGVWTVSANSFSTPRLSPTSMAYNGYIYVVEGLNSTPSNQKDIQWAPILANGDVGAWQLTTTLPGASGDYRQAMVASNGYVYITTGNIYGSQIFYAPINANGSFGNWTTSSQTVAPARYSATLVAYNGYIYVNGGFNGTMGQSDTQYFKIDPPGQVNPWGSLANNFVTARSLGCSTAYNSFLYEVGGSTADTTGSNVATTAAASLNATNGSNSAWNANTSLPEARGSMGCVAYNGFIYTIGGYTGTAAGAGTPSALVRYAPLSTSNGSIGTWVTSAPSLPAANALEGVFIQVTSTGSYIYAIGGTANAGGASPTVVYSAPLAIDTGQVGTWTTSTNSLSQSWSARGYAQVGKYLYAFGGSDLSSNITNLVEYTSINEDGSINPWIATASMNTAVAYTHGATINGCIYQVGGADSTATAVATVQYACPAANGTISGWQTAPSLASATTDAGVGGYNGFLYIIGGYTTAVTAASQYTYANNGGSGGQSAWTTNTTDLSTPYPSGYAYGRAFASGGYMYIVGGWDGTTVSNAVWSAPIGVDGSLGSWTQQTGASLVQARYSFGIAVYNGYVYVAGGIASAGGYLASVESAQILSNGAVSSWSSSTVGGSGVAALASSLAGAPIGRQLISLAAYNGFIYTAGGSNGSSQGDTQYAAINNGSVGTWTQLTGTSSFTTPRFGAGVVVANGYIYVLGGSPSSVSYSSDVQYAPLLATGGITAGTWKYTTGLINYERYVIASAYSGFIYIISSGNSNLTGSGGGITITRTQSATIRPDGTLGIWTFGPSVTSSSHYQAATTINNGYMYRLGGFDGSSYFKDIQWTALQSQPRSALYTKLVDLGSAENLSGIVYNGNIAGPGGPSNVIFETADASGVPVVVNPAAITSTTCANTSGLSSIRYVMAIFFLDDSVNAVYPDTPSRAANVTDFTVSYVQGHPLLAQRLRTGQTLQSGGISPLDICVP